MTSAVSVRAHAKVNLFLGVGERRADGFHELSTIFQAVSLHDDVTVTAGREEVTVAGLDPERVPADPTNLAARAARAVVERTGREVDLGVHIDKGIPTAGGMAGGSADAAGALVAADRLLGAGLGEAELLEMAAQLGSDVPFTLRGGTALGTGRGEKLVPVLARGTFHWVFAISAQGLSTPEVFAKLDELRDAGKLPGPRTDATAVLSAVAAGDARALAEAMHNDLEAAAFSLRPDLRRMREAARGAGALRTMLSGSGPTMAFLCASGTDAEAVADELTGANLCRAAFVAEGPQPGVVGLDW